ncbi:ELMO domain-containing protein 2 [Anthonomus grandis grandis]|uniref:ELMO domain-containing protein 2 n=1 Tax=Anthonomus grandis grandis TaxID=2921223 RepID=UPI0021659AC1|nr:ELMO domain-containing protein 2 [Anthonomus grandis grandis]XP_050301984.1 ELMO domain-containing protein 2 [Anthonomus grandis grandis]
MIPEFIMNLSIWWFLYCYVRSIIKWFLRKTTGFCELQRICYGEVSGAPRVKGVEQSLYLSKSKQIRQLVDHLNDIAENRRFTGANEREILRGAVSTVLLVKRINPKIHQQFVTAFGKCVEQIWGYKQLMAEVEMLRQTPFDCDDFEHERKLYDLWENLMPHEQLEGRITKQWQDIGFQGDDPKTDFRGMGLLGLENLLFFATEYKAPAQHVLSHSMHPQYGYCFAIVGINLTSMAWSMLRDGSAKTYFYNTSRSLPAIRLFHSFYSYLFYEFDKFWVDSKPTDIMEFSAVRDKFEKNVRVSLQNPRTEFKIALTVEIV